ncbi:hypothetical protein EV702DRAFT_1199854 [Suillus placidus]|uniref:Uncharacterized protein n=1 Tax=Suillus placidus TaxID=48579 RepID=A0A9P7CZV3_9AGAM|nr:hypothetical protein EV702DRAFT_1199854 [Suillus placidus]
MASACPSLYSSRSMPQSRALIDIKVVVPMHHARMRESKSGQITEEEHVNSPQRKRMKTSQESVSRPPASEPRNAAATKVSPRHRPEEPHTTTESTPKQKLKTTALEKLINKSAAKPCKVVSTGPRNCEEEDEDAYIAYLEAKLGYAGGGSRRKDDDMDGLGDLFDLTENIMTEMPDSGLSSLHKLIGTVFAAYFVQNNISPQSK